MRSKGFYLFFALLLLAPLISITAQSASWSEWRGSPIHTGTAEGELPTEGKLRWSFRANDQVLSSPSFYDGGMLIGSDDGWIYSLDPDTGSVNWKFKTGGLVQTTALIHGSRAYFGSADGKMYCIQLPGDDNVPFEIWSFDCGAQIFSSAHYYSDSILFGCHDGNLYRLSLGGDLVWKTQIGNEIWASPTIDEGGGLAYIGSIDGTFRCISLDDGSILWSFETVELYSSAALHNGLLYFGGGEDDMFWALDADNGSVVWSFDVGYPIYSSPTIYDDKVYFGSFEYCWCLPVNDPDASGMIEEDEVLWSTQTRDFQGGSSPLLNNNTLYIGSDDYNMYCMDATTGDILWNYTVKGYIYSSPVLHNGSIYFGSCDWTVSCIGNRPIGLSVRMVPDSVEFTSDNTIGINLTVFDQNEVRVAGSLIHFTVSAGEVTFEGDAITDRNGAFHAVYLPPVVSSRSTIEITVRVRMEDMADGITTVSLIVEPGEDTGEEVGSAIDLNERRIPYILGAGAIILLNLLFLVLIVLFVRSMGYERETLKGEIR